MSQCRYSDTRVSEISNELGVLRKTFTAAGDVILLIVVGYIEVPRFKLEGAMH